LKAIASQAAISIQNARLFKERIETEQALSKKEKQLSDFLEAMPVGVFIANSAQKTYYLNQTARKILGRGVESVSFEDLAKFYNAYDTNQNIVYPEDKSPVGRALKGEKSYTSDMEIRRPDLKDPIPLDVWSTPIKNEKGEVEYAIAAFQDISDRKKAKEELETKNAELETTKQQLKEVNRTLEEKVKERTKELQEAVGILKQTQKKLIDENYSLKDSNKSKYFYLGGKVPPESPSYVIRNADVILVRALKEGEYCYIFNGRTMGKSSLLARTQKEFESKGFKCAEIDMSKISYKDITANQWYLGLIDELLASFDLIDKFDCFEWWMKWEILSPPQRFNKFITQILLKLVPEQIIIFFDEIDSLICLKFNTDDFFVLLRSFYNARGNSFGFERLNIVLLGAANPLSLIKDYTRTPFNIGQIIRLEPFEFYQMNPLIEGLKNICVCPESIIKEILYWTGGQPFLTQKLCSIVYKSSEKIERGDEKQVIAKLVRDEIIEDWTTKDRPQHLTTISDRLLFTNSSSELLKLCQLLLETGEIPFSENDPLHEELVLTGLVYVKSNKIKLYNRIYENIFDRNWIADNSSIS
ncbi:MAG: AAA-like domain-containing protein, partial [Prochloraceae cyanobacterium]